MALDFVVPVHRETLRRPALRFFQRRHGNRSDYGLRKEVGEVGGQLQHKFQLLQAFRLPSPKLLDASSKALTIFHVVISE